MLIGAAANMDEQLILAIATATKQFVREELAASEARLENVLKNVSTSSRTARER